MQRIYLMMLLPADPATALDVVVFEMSACLVSEVTAFLASEE